ncbi:MAG: DUF1847 domain-containing protein [Candidatus Korobacteraceae bacterium]|jgi:uncharacterized metal-binding protein
MSNTAVSCSECGPLNCYRKEKEYPDFCLTEAVDRRELEAIVEHLRGDNADGRMARAAAEIEGMYYCRATRAEEIVLFARRIGAKRIGVATCRGLIQEARTFVKVLRAKGLEAFTVVCKIGSVDKTEIGVPNEVKIEKGAYEAMCNPILQAKTLNAHKTELNVLVGLCVGHDSLFIKYSEAPVTTLVTKDRVLAHNPVAALYETHSYYRRLLDPKNDPEKKP